MIFSSNFSVLFGGLQLPATHVWGDADRGLVLIVAPTGNNQLSMRQLASPDGELVLRFLGNDVKSIPLIAKAPASRLASLLKGNYVQVPPQKEGDAPSDKLVSVWECLLLQVDGVLPDSMFAVDTATLTRLANPTQKVPQLPTPAQYFPLFRSQMGGDKMMQVALFKAKLSTTPLQLDPETMVPFKQLLQPCGQHAIRVDLEKLTDTTAKEGPLGGDTLVLRWYIEWQQCPDCAMLNRPSVSTKTPQQYLAERQAEAADAKPYTGGVVKVGAKAPEKPSVAAPRPAKLPSTSKKK